MGPMAVAGLLHFLGDEANALLAIKVVARVRFHRNCSQNGCGSCRWGHLLVVLEFCIATAVDIISYETAIACAVLICSAE